MPLRTFIVDDHHAMREGLCILFKDSPVEVIGKAGNGSDAIDMIQALCNGSGGLDVALIDVQLPGEDGLSTLAQLRKSHPDLRIVMMSAFEYPIYVARAAANGAQDFVYKSVDPTHLVRILSHAVEERTPHPDGTLHRVQTLLLERINPKTLPDAFPVTAREAQVLRHMALGLSNREISQNLKISVETVKEHVQNILRKTQSSDRTEAAVKAVRGGLVDFETRYS